MLLGYVFDFFEVHGILTNGAELDDSGPVEDFARKNQIRFDFLNYRECILALNLNLPDQIEIIKLPDYLERHKSALINLENVLKAHNLPLGELVLISEPLWDGESDPDKD